ncbi:MAG: hypothetical protein M3P33_00670 [bacterium]|nr:hypothetical protein [bacterium]
MKNNLSIIFTLLTFVLITQAITPVFGVTGPDEDFSTSTPIASTKPIATATGQVKSATAPPIASPSAVIKQPINSLSKNGKLITISGTLSATPSAIGKFLIKREDVGQSIDTDKNTKIISISSTNQKTKILLSKIKINSPIIVVGEKSLTGNIFLASYVISPTQTIVKPKVPSYGVVSNREASGAATFILEIKSPNSEEKTKFVINSETTVKVKELVAPKLSDIKIGDRVTLLSYFDEKLGVNFVTHIFAIPGRASGLLRDMREASPTATATSTIKPAPTKESTASPTKKP